MTTESEHNENEAVAVSQDSTELRRTGCHDSSQPSLLASFKTPAMPISFEAAQILLQRAGDQLKVPDQEPEQAKDRQAALMDELMLDCLIRSFLYDLTMPEKMLREIHLMNIKRLSEIVDKLTLTPKSLAVRYLTWVHESLGTEEPNPLVGWLSEFKKHIDLNHADDRPHHLFRGAERQVFIWVGLYVAALLGWLEEFCAAVPLVEITAARVKFGLVRPELARQLLDRRNRLLEWAAVMQIIEQEHLHAPILPDAWRRWLEPVELDFIIAKFLGRSGGRSVAKVCKPAECRDRARVKLAALLETACATADITSCYQRIFSLTQAQIMLTNRREAWKQLSALLEWQEAERGRRKPARSSPSASPPARRKFPSGAPKRKKQKQASGGQ